MKNVIFNSLVLFSFLCSCKEPDAQIKSSRSEEPLIQNLEPWRGDLKKYPVAAFINNERISKETEEDIYLKESRLADILQICANSDLAQETSAASCGGFLISNKHVLTSFSCIETIEEIQPDQSVKEIASCPNGLHGKSSRVVFNFDSAIHSSGKELKIRKEDVYDCKKVVAFQNHTKNKYGFAIIELDRKVETLKPLKINFQRLTADYSANLIIPSLPEGSPLKFSKIKNWSTDWEELNNNSNLVSLKAFAFRKSHGLPLIDSENNIVIGIREVPLLYWAFRFDHTLGCYKLNHSDDDGKNSDFFPTHLMENLKFELEKIKN